MSRRAMERAWIALLVVGLALMIPFEETLRVDPAHHILGLRINFFLAVALTVVGLAWFARVALRPRRRLPAAPTGAR